MGIVATMLGTRATLDLCLAGIVRSFATEYQATPVARTALAFGLFRCKHNRCRFGALGNEFAATLYNESSHGLLVALDNGTRLNGKF